jgi:hypothetical protein
VKKFGFLRESLSGVATEMLERVSKEGGDMEQGDRSVIGLLSTSIFVCIFCSPFNLLYIDVLWMEGNDLRDL